MHSYAEMGRKQRSNPIALVLIVGAHAVAIATLLAAKMDMPIIEKFPPTIVDLIKDKPPEPVEPVEPQHSTSTIDTVAPVIPSMPAKPLVIDDVATPTIPTGPTIGPIFDPPVRPTIDPPIVKTGPKLATTGEALRPPYPDSKLASGEEATLRLKLWIDANGRVIQVEPIGRADSAFLREAKRHILKVWRYKPAMEGERTVASTTTVSITFELTG